MPATSGSADICEPTNSPTPRDRHTGRLPLITVNNNVPRIAIATTRDPRSTTVKRVPLKSRRLVVNARATESGAVRIAAAFMSVLLPHPADETLRGHIKDQRDPEEEQPEEEQALEGVVVTTNSVRTDRQGGHCCGHRLAIGQRVPREERPTGRSCGDGDHHRLSDGPGERQNQRRHNPRDCGGHDNPNTGGHPTGTETVRGFAKDAWNGPQSVLSDRGDQGNREDPDPDPGSKHVEVANRVTEHRLQDGRCDEGQSEEAEHDAGDAGEHLDHRLEQTPGTWGSVLR